MRFALSEEQRGFADSLAEMLRRADTVAAARAWAGGDHGPGLALWRRLADQGVCGLVVAEADGGLGATDVDLVVAHEALGHHLAVGPWLESVYLAGVLRGRGPGPPGRGRAGHRVPAAGHAVRPGRGRGRDRLPRLGGGRVGRAG